MTVRGATTQTFRVELLTYQEVAAMLRVSVRTVERLVADGQLTCVRPTPSTPRIHSDDLRAYVAARRQEAAPSRPSPPRLSREKRRHLLGAARPSFLDELAAVEQ